MSSSTPTPADDHSSLPAGYQLLIGVVIAVVAIGLLLAFIYDGRF